MELDFKKLKLNVQPHVMAGLLSLDDRSEHSFRSLDTLVKSDQNMTTLILKAANSSLYSRGNEIRTLQHAIALLGFQVVRSLAMVASSQALFETGNYKRFRTFVWEHSIVTAIISKDIASKTANQEHVEEVFIAGLLHAIGKVVLNTVDRKKFISVLDMVGEGTRSFVDAERHIYGTDHLKVGGQAAREWKLPAIYVTPIEKHGDAEAIRAGGAEDPGYTLAAMVGYASYLAKKNGFGLFHADDDALGEQLASILNISEEDQAKNTDGYRDSIAGNEFYSFFMSVV